MMAREFSPRPSHRTTSTAPTWLVTSSTRAAAISTNRTSARYGDRGAEIRGGGGRLGGGRHRRLVQPDPRSGRTRRRLRQRPSPSSRFWDDDGGYPLHQGDRLRV